MRYRYAFLTILIPLMGSINLYGQKNNKEKLTEALYLMDEKQYTTALPILEDLYNNEGYSDNANVNYNIGLALLNSVDGEVKPKSIPYLELASKNVSPNYIPFDPKEKSAPVDAFYYLGKAQHAAYQFADAIDNFEIFKTKINEKNIYYFEMDKLIQMAEYAKKALENPVNIKVTNLGKDINSKYGDYSPAVRIDESAIYFTSRRLRADSSNYQVFDPSDGKLFEDIYVSYNDKGHWGKPHLLNINTPGHEATINLTIDGQTLFVYKDVNGNGLLFKSKLTGDSAGVEIWSKPKLLGSDINSDAFETHVTVSPDGRTLYFVSTRGGGYGGKDIYFCNLLPTGEWALAQNAGPTLNTEFDEDGVFMHPDGKTMYFSSNGHESMGGYDIMYSTLEDTGWTQVQNMGYPINSVDDDVFFVTTPDGRRAYFSSFKKGGYGEKDLYMINLLDVEETPLTLYRGEFTYVDRKTPPKGAMVTISNNKTNEMVGTYLPRPRDGQFSAILEPNNSYHFTYEADGYRTYEEDIFVPEGTDYQEIYKAIQLSPVRVGNNKGDKMKSAKTTMATVNGEIKSYGKPLLNTNVNLLSEDKKIIAFSETGDDGTFIFVNLDPLKSYILQIDTKNPPLYGYDIKMINDKGENLTVEKIDNKNYRFSPSLSPYEKYGIQNANQNPTVSKNGVPLANAKVRLENEDHVVLNRTLTDSAGAFQFSELDADNPYWIVFDSVKPDQLNLTIINEKGKRITFVKVKDGTYKYSANKNEKEAIANTENGKLDQKYSVSLLDSDGNILTKSVTDNLSDFNYIELIPTQKFQIVFEDTYPNLKMINLKGKDGKTMVFKKVSDGVYEYNPNYNFNFKPYTVGVDDKSDFSTTYPKPEELDGVITYYQRYFEYNKTNIDIESQDFVNFISDIQKIIETQGNAVISITSSASKVPTKTWKSNSILTKKRAMATKDLLDSELQKKGISKDQYNIVDINTLITGPAYKGDYDSKRSTYEKYQFVRIFIR